MCNILRLLTLWILIIFTSTLRLANFQQDILDDYWHDGSGSAASELTPDEQDNCYAEDNDADDQEIDLIFVNEEPKQYSTDDCAQEPLTVFSNNSVNTLKRPLINSYWETQFDKIESPSEAVLLASLLLRSPPYFTL